jgi:hypothetical protein
MIANLDENVGRLRARLAALGLERNTILIFMTDNGTAAGSYNAGMRGRKGSPYEGGHRVPCFLHHPAGGLTGGRDLDQLTAHVDVLPTLVDLCRLECRPAKPAFDGTSLAPLLEGRGNPVEDRVLVESFRRVVMTDRWRLVNERELYDVRKDPAQRRDVAGEFPDVVAALKKTLDDYRRTEDHRPHYVVVGSDRQNPVTLTGEDWQVGPLIYQYWMGGVPRHTASQVWNVQVARAGRYRVALRRWPKETSARINAALPKGKWCHRMTRCDALAAVEARIRVGDAEHATPVTDEMQEAEFTVELAAGATTLQGWFVDDANKSWAACYVSVEQM